jgi:putative ABC transport system permease protein
VLACVVLVPAGLLVKSLARLVHVDTGFVPDNLLTMNIGLVSYKDPQHRVAAISRVLQELSSLPGVEYAGGSTGLAPVTPQRATRFAAKGVSLTQGTDSAYLIAASPAYFQALGTPVLARRGFTDRDTAKSAKVIAVTDLLARRLFPNESPIGKNVRLINPEYSGEWRTVVGVVRTVRYAGLAEADQPAIYVPFSQAPMFWMYVLVRHQCGRGNSSAPLPL